MDMANLEKLGAQIYGATSMNPQQDIETLEKKFGVSLPLEFSEIFCHFGGAITFEKGAKFKPDEKTPWDDENGYQSLEIIYGIGESKNSIAFQQSHYQDQLPERVLVIGEAPGGNQICLGFGGEVFFWNHEKDFKHGHYLIASSFSKFLHMLEPGDEEIGPTEGIVDSESWLDF